MNTILHPVINDALNADYNILWTDPNSRTNGKCKIFTYGKGIDLAIAIFNSLYPGYKIKQIEKLNQVL